MMVEFNKSVDIAFYYQLLWLCNVRPLVLSRHRGTKFRNLGAEKQDNRLSPEKIDIFIFIIKYISVSFLVEARLQCSCQSVSQKMLADFNRIWQWDSVWKVSSFYKLQKDWWFGREREWSRVFLCAAKTAEWLQQYLQPTRQLVFISVWITCCISPSF